MGKSDPNKEISDTELLEAIEASGYPLELSLYQEFQAAGMDPTLGARLRSRSPGSEQSTHEIDLMVRVHHAEAHPEGGYASSLLLTGLIDAKKLHAPARFIGLVGEQPTTHEFRVSRSYFSGCPSFRVLSDRAENYSDLFIGEGGLSRGFDPLNDGKFCVHWGIAKRDGNGVATVRGDGSKESNTPSAFKEERYWQSMANLVACTVWHEREGSRFMESADLDAGPMPRIDLCFPTLIVDTPSLEIYDPSTKKLEHVDWFILRTSFEVEGEVHTRLIDIVTTAGVPAMVKRYKDAAALMLEAADRNGPALRGVGLAHRMRAADARKQRPKGAPRS